MIAPFVYKMFAKLLRVPIFQHIVTRTQMLDILYQHLRLVGMETQGVSKSSTDEKYGEYFNQGFHSFVFPIRT